ncbi:hypothetical protein EFN62_10665 [Pediococcus parvulus]|nr:hypothetical protein [Pediococcus parvulus]
MVNTILKEADLFCPNSVRINFTIYPFNNILVHLIPFIDPGYWSLLRLVAFIKSRKTKQTGQS